MKTYSSSGVELLQEMHLMDEAYDDFTAHGREASL